MGEQAEQAEALWYVSPGRVEIRAETIGPPAAGEVRLSALYGGISRGTERLVLNGRIPVSEHSRMRSPNMAGDFPFPVKYGYATVGRIESGPADLVGRIGFALYPHQTAFNLPVELVALLPEDVPASRGVLAANMETALNAVWDAAPGPADRIAIVGAGVVGVRCAPGCAPSCPARRSRWSTSIPVAPKSQPRWGPASPRPSMPPAIATSSSMRAPPRPGWRRRCVSPATRRPSSS